MKVFVLAFFILSLGCSLIESVNLNCQFKTTSFYVLGSVNTCDAQSQGDIITDISNRDVTTISGSTNSNPSVKVVYIGDSNCFYFPLDLVKFFINLEGIEIYNSKLREIRRDDLKEYKNLTYLDLYGNEIQFLEPNLFEFNQKLEGIWLDDNKIAHIDANVFNNFLGKLSYLWLSGNICQFENAKNDKSKINQIIEKVQSGSCNDATVLPTTATTTTPITTSTTIPTTTTSASPSVLCDQFETFMKLIENIQLSLMQEVKTLGDKVNGELATLKDKLVVLEINQNEMKVGIANIVDKDQKCYVGGNVEGRLEFIENQLGVSTPFHTIPTPKP